MELDSHSSPIGNLIIEQKRVTTSIMSAPELGKPHLGTIEECAFFGLFNASLNTDSRQVWLV